MSIVEDRLAKQVVIIIAIAVIVALGAGFGLGWLAGTL